MTEDSFSKRIAEAARQMEGEVDPGTTMDLAIRLGLQLVTNAQEAGISLIQQHRVETPARSSEVVDRIDQLQYEHQQGPCLDAIREHEVVCSPDVRSDERWPLWGPAASEETGVRSMLCFRLFTHGDKYGAINFYSQEVDAFDDGDQEHGLAIAAHMAVAIAAAQEIDHLKVGLHTRTVIGQAQGILMERFGIDAARAFGVLVRYSSTSNRKLREVAQDVVDRRRLHDVPPS